MSDIVNAIVDLLKADAGVSALCGERVFGGELPPDEAQSMPRAAIVVQPGGGVPFAPAAQADLEAQRLDIVSYGVTPTVAAELRRAAFAALRTVRRRVVSMVLIHWVQSAGGYLSGRDRDGQWPYAFQSIQTLFATDEVA